MPLTSLKNPCSVLDNQKTTPWFLNRTGNSDPCYLLVGVPTPENLDPWWEPKCNTLPRGQGPGCLSTLESLPKSPHCCQLCSKRGEFSSQLPKGCPYSILPHTSCKADGKPAPLWQIHFVAQLEHSHGVYFICGNRAYLPLPSFW